MEGLSVEPATAPPLDVQSNNLNLHEGNGLQSGYQPHDGVFRLAEAANQHMEVENDLSRLDTPTFVENSRSGQAANQRTTAVGHRDPTISCDMCPKRFDTQAAAKDHMTALRHMIPRFPCKRCPMKFQTKVAANAHMAAVGHAIPTIPCKKCPRKFHTRSAVNEHMIAVKH
jgi:hypothetical protein